MAYKFNPFTGNLDLISSVSPTVQTPNYVETFNATTDWGVASGGFYNIPISVGTHGKGTNPIIQVYELVSNLSEVLTADVPIDDDAEGLMQDNTNIFGQTFTPTTNGDVIKVKFRLRRNGAPTGNVVVNLYATSAGEPTGAALEVSDPVDISTIATVGAQDIEFIFSGTTALTAGTVYHVGVSSAGLSGLDSSNYLSVYRSDLDTYAGGTIVFSTDNGSTWASQARDFSGVVVTVSSGEDTYDLVDASISVNMSGDVLIGVTETPDNRFEGKIIISENN